MKLFMLRFFSPFLSLLLLFAVGFDPDGAQYGLALFTPPEFAIAIAHFIGNLLWVLGVLFVFLAVVLIVEMSVTEVMEKAMERAKDTYIWPVWGRRDFFGQFMMVFSFVGSIFAIGSGFWFYGFTWLIATSCSTATDSVRGKMRAKYEAKQLLEGEADD